MSNVKNSRFRKDSDVLCCVWEVNYRRAHMSDIPRAQRITRAHHLPRLFHTLASRKPAKLFFPNSREQQDRLRTSQSLTTTESFANVADSALRLQPFLSLFLIVSFIPFSTPSFLFLSSSRFVSLFFSVLEQKKILPRSMRPQL